MLKITLRVAAHDLRSPLQTVQLYAELLRIKGATMSAEQVDKRMQHIFTAVDRMNTIIGRLLTFGRIEADHIALDCRNVNFAQTLHELVETQRMYAHEKQIEIRTEFAENETMYVDAGLLEQVCINLLSNAVKYSPANTTVTISLHRRDRGDLGALGLVAVFFSLLVAFGIVVDALHIMSERDMRRLLVVIEDGGEMLAVAGILCVAIGLNRTGAAYYERANSLP